MSLADCDYIHIKDLKLAIYLGVNPWEHGCRQQLVFDIKLYRSLDGCQDQLQNTICYARYCEGLKQVFSEHVELLETVAEKTVAYSLHHFPIQAVEVVVKKRHMIQACDYLAVRMLRKA